MNTFMYTADYAIHISCTSPTTHNQGCGVGVWVGVGVGRSQQFCPESESPKSYRLTTPESELTLHGSTPCTSAPVWLTILRSTLDFFEKKKHFLFWTNVFSERSRRRWIPQNLLFNSACYFFNAYLQRKALERTRDRFRQDKNISIMNFNIRYTF